MKTYTVYDNLNEGFYIYYQYYDYKNQKLVQKEYKAKSKSFMLLYAKMLESNGYRFVGRLSK